jgi:hypothetical protein
MTKEKSTTNNSSFTVNTITIPEIIKSYGHIDILKLDVEGAEFNLFDENSMEWLKLVNVIMIEFHDRFVPGCSRRFFNTTNDFPLESVKGENFCIARKGWLKNE